VLDELEVELFGGIVAKYGAVMREVELKVVGNTESLS